MIREPLAGQILSDKYRIERVLGRGAGVVLAARHLQLDELVAIKLLPEVALEHEALVRFEREARAATRIRSQHAARVLDFGTLEGGQPFTVMEYIEGVDFGALLSQRGRLPQEDATSFLLQTAEVLAEAHGMGIVHGDLKPSNLFVARCDGSVLVKVLDLGISRWSGAATHYMSPEQMTTASDVDARADVWALGVILFELVCGHPPFIGESPLELCRLVLYGATPSVTEFVPELPRELDAVIQGCLAKSHEQRYAGMSELAQALLPFAPRRAALSFERISRLLPTGSTQPAS